ncbi:hypothetical protein COHA_003866 [Chlorella ohadii]|uniref:Peptidase S8/S53 domain-containing protein n=1 Tax=Chlorella ohadii TaxID=2649997 RepID=A0AAD5H7M9_9CHLO|nr:hypothetical protein COHA_003866 [Chlorella ohadii]
MRTALLVALAAALVAVGRAGGPSVARPRQAGQPQSSPTEVIVQFHPGFNPATEIPALMDGAKLSRKLRASATEGDLVLVELPKGQSVAAAKGAFDKGRDPDGRGSVRYVEENFKVSKMATTNDPDLRSGALWGMTGTFGIQAPAAWDSHTDCSNVYVGVVDEGVQYTHPDLAANMWTNAAEAGGVPGADDDGNGYVDDVHGYDFYNNKGDVFTPTDGDAHGTHVSGTIGGVANNSIGVSGVCWSIKIISAKFLGPNGGYIAGAVQALDYLTQLKLRKGLNIVASSNSWGCGSSCYSQSLFDAISRAYNAGILFIAAAGNEATTAVSYPAGYKHPGVTGVAALQSDGALASYSNRGTASNPWVHIGAPGSGIKSTVPSNTYATYSGTSMACPHVSGAAALYKAEYPAATADQVKAAILRSATPTASLANGITSTGGRLNAADMLRIVPGVAPTCSCASNQYCASGICYSCPSTCTTCTSSTSCSSCVLGYRGAACTIRCNPAGALVSKCSTCCSGACISNKLKQCK